MREFFQSLQDSDFSAAVLGSSSIWAFPLVLTLHTIGLAMLVGASLMVDLRVLGVASDIPLARLRVLTKYMWLGFIINLISGTVLFILNAADRAEQAMFGYKLLSIVFALVFTGLVNKSLHASATAGRDRILPGAKLFALGSILMWIAAIITGRLMAYFP
jgi:hypothetical protein